VSPLKSRMTYKDVANSVSKFGGILFTPFRLTNVACYAAWPLKVRLSFKSFHLPPPPPKPLHKHRYISRDFITAHFFSWLTLHALNIACSEIHCGFKISTLAYEANSGCWPERLSVAYCTHIIHKKVMLKNWRYPQISMYTATGGPTDVPLVVLG
jgi:hypothetical protein